MTNCGGWAWLPPPSWGCCCSAASARGQGLCRRVFLLGSEIHLSKSDLFKALSNSLNLVQCNLTASFEIHQLPKPDSVRVTQKELRLQQSVAVGQEGTSPLTWPAAPRAAGSLKEDQMPFFPERSGWDKVEKGQPCSKHQGRGLKNGNVRMALCKRSAGNAFSNVTELVCVISLPRCLCKGLSMPGRI